MSSLVKRLPGLQLLFGATAAPPAMSSCPPRCPTMEDLTQRRQADIRRYGRATTNPL